MSSSRPWSKAAHYCLYVAKIALMGPKPLKAPNRATFRGTATPNIKAQNPKLSPSIAKSLADEDAADGVV